MINSYMTLKKFITLQPRDMQNGAVHDEICYALKRLDEYENGTRKSLELTVEADAKQSVLALCPDCDSRWEDCVCNKSDRTT